MKFIQLASLGRRSLVRYSLAVTLIFSVFLFVGQFAYDYSMDLVGVSSDETKNYSLTQARDLMDKNLFLSVNLLPFVVVFFTLILIMQVIHNRPFLSVITSRSQFDWKRFFLSFISFGVLVGAGLTYTLNTTDYMQWNYHSNSFWMLLAISFFVLPLQTAVEEILFRGYMLQGSINWCKKPIISMVVSSVIFASLHIDNPEVEKLGVGILLYYFASGLFMSLLTILDDGLELSLGFHTVNNIFGALVVTSNWQVFQTDALFLDTSAPVIGWELWITVFGFYPLLLLFFHKLYRWEAWWKVLFTSVVLEVEPKNDEIL